MHIDSFGLLYCGLCRFFDIEKQLSIILELVLIVLLVLLPLEYDFVPTTLIKSTIYNSLYDDIVLCKVSEFVTLENLLYTIVFIAIFWGE